MQQVNCKETLPIQLFIIHYVQNVKDLTVSKPFHTGWFLLKFQSTEQKPLKRKQLTL